MDREELYWGRYFSFFDDGTMGCSDGVGYVGTVEREEVEDLYEVLKRYFEDTK